MDYGDYLAVNLKELRTSTFDNCQWRLDPSLDWQQIDAFIQSERHAIGDFDEFEVVIYSSSSPPRQDPSQVKTPWLDDVAKAATTLGISRDQLLFEIKTYAARNQLCHSGVGKFIDTADWGRLATQIIHDKGILDPMFRDRPQEMLAWRRAIGRVQTRFFKYLHDRDGCPTYNLTEEADKRLKRILNRQS